MYMYFLLTKRHTCKQNQSLEAYTSISLYSMFGDFREMVLHYFLADNTIEILEKIPPNSGRDAVSMFLRRASLPKEPVPHCQPGVQTKRTVLNVFGPTGHGGRYILDSLKVHVHYKSILMWNIHTVLLHMYCISQIPSHVRVSRQTFCNDENFVNQTLNFTVPLMESNSIALSLSLSLSLCRLVLLRLNTIMRVI